MRALLGAAWLLASSACIDRLGPDVGPPAGDAAVADPDAQQSTCDDDSDPQRTVSFSADIAGVFQRGDCKRCHLPGREGTDQSGLDLSSYATLRAGGTRSGAGIVIDGKPCTSVLFEKVTMPPFGGRMPLGGTPLSMADRQLLHDWISEGAHDN